MDTSTRTKRYLEALCANHESQARAIIQSALNDGISPRQIYLDIFDLAMAQISALWEENSISVAQEHLATAITEQLISELSPMFTPRQLGQQRIILGGVAGESRVLSLRLLSDIFKAEGWHVLFMGANVPADEWEHIARRTDPQAVVLAIHTRRLIPQVKQIIERIRQCSPRSRIAVGGNVFLHDMALGDQVGADICASDIRQIIAALGVPISV